MAKLEIRLLGGLQVRHDDANVTQFISGKVSALLAYLAVTRRSHQRDALAGLLWGEMPDTAAANNLRQALTNLRKLFDPYLIITRDTVAFDVAAPSFLDVDALQDGLQRSAGQPVAQRIDLLRHALALYQGEFLEGISVRDAPDFEDWALVQRVHLRELALQGWDSLAGLLLETGDYEGAGDAAGRQLAMDPWREEAHRQRMLALARAGRRSAALAQYQICRHILQDEFGVEPSVETTALYDRVRVAMRGPHHNLPTPSTGLVGREPELAELRSLLASPHTQLLTILGAGGVGKTRLALAAAAVCQPMFLNGVWFAQLAATDNPAALPRTLADALGLSLMGSESAESQLLDFLRRKELLLILDNFEHLISASALGLLSRIVQQAADVKLLITSRVRLNLTVEQLYDLSGLGYPTDSAAIDVKTYAAVQLFVRRGRRVRSDFALTADITRDVVHICQMTEGLPLAIELAAAWVRTLTPAQIAANLAGGLALLSTTAYDASERHRSMTAVFDYSWEMLDAVARGTLAQLSVCRGGFDLPAAQAVAGTDLPTLQALVNQSWLQVNATGRYDMHPLVQQFAAAKLVPGTSEDARDRHARHFAALTTHHEHEFHGQEDHLALRWMSLEADNVRAAWAWSVQQVDIRALEQFLESFLYFFDIQGRYSECVELTGDALRALESAALTASKDPPPDPTGLTRATGRTLALHAAFQFRLGEFEAAKQNAGQALGLLEPLRPHRDVGHACLYLGAAWYGLGDLGHSVTWFLAAAAAYEEVGHGWGIGAALDNAGYLEFLRGNFSVAEVHLMRTLEVARQTGSRYLLTGAYDHLATLTAAQGRFAEAMDYVQRCRHILGELDRPYIVSHLSLSLSQIAVQAGDLAAAQDHIERALQVARETGNRLDLARFLLQSGAVTVACGNFDAALTVYREAAEVAREIHGENLLVEVVAGLADRAWAMGQRPIAATLYHFVQQQGAASQETIDRLASLAGRKDPKHPPVALHNLDQALALALSVEGA